MDPATSAMIARAAIAAGTDKKVWTGIASVAAAICLPLVLVIVCFMGIASGGANHNAAAVRLSFSGGDIGANMPSDYRAYISQMQESFQKLDEVFIEINNIAEGEVQDDFFVKSAFYSLYFGEENLRLKDTDYQNFADCFVRYETRTRTVLMEYGKKIEETYTVTVAITDKMEIFQKLQNEYGIPISHEDKSNAVNVWYVAKYGASPPLEGDEFSDWGSWGNQESVSIYELPASEVGGKIVSFALSRLGNPYSQAQRGKGNYVDCSYLTLWCYRQVGITIPGTAAEQARYCVDNKLTISKQSLQPGDLVFWSHKPNGRFMNVTHVGVYAGNGMVIDASSSKGKVVHRNLFDSDKQVLYGRPK